MCVQWVRRACLGVPPSPVLLPNPASSAGKFVSWYRPATLAQLLELRTRFPSAKMVVGNTEVCVLCIVC